MQKNTCIYCDYVYTVHYARQQKRKGKEAQKFNLEENGMKFLIDQDFRVLRRGEYVTASEEAGEFILDTEKCDYPNATLWEIAGANAIHSIGTKDPKKIICQKLEQELATRKIPTMKNMTDTQKVEEIVQKGNEEGWSEDDMLIEIVKAGIKFNAAIRQMRQALQSLGLSISPKDRYEQGKQLLTKNGLTDLHTYAEVEEAAELLANELPDTSLQQAMSVLRKYSKEMEFELPRKPKTERGGGVKQRIYKWIAKNPTADANDLRDFVSTLTPTIQENPERVDRLVKRWTPVLNLASQVYKNAVDEKEIMAA